MIVAAGYCIGICVAAAIAWLDHMSHGRVSFYLLYFPSIIMVAWFGGRVAGIVMSLVCTSAWTLAAWPVVTSLALHDRILSVTLHVLTMSVVAWMTVALGQAKHRRDAIQKKQGDRLDVEIGLARHDHLTGALNSRGFHEKFSEERAKIMRYGRTTSLLHLDLDHFKEINDEHGHQFGDEMLKRVVSIINDNVRAVDSVARTGGDEFVVLLPETGSRRAEACASRILVQMKKNLRDPLTGSIGIVSFGHVSESNMEISKMADEAMYLAKTSGRDRIVVKDLSIEAENRMSKIGV